MSIKITETTDQARPSPHGKQNENQEPILRIRNTLLSLEAACKQLEEQCQREHSRQETVLGINEDPS